MAYTLPPTVAFVQLALVVGVAQVNIVAAPGATRAIRVMHLDMRINKAATGIVDLAVNDAGAFVFAICSLSPASSRSHSMDYPDPGVQLPVNAPLNFITDSTIAAGNGEVVAIFYVDEIS